jgi:hypothetical protein
MNDVNFRQGFEQAWAAFMTFIPKLFLAAVIVVVGYFVAKLLCRGLSMVLHRVGFDRLVERGGIKRVLERTPYDASGLLGRILFYCVLLVALQFAFGVFGQNPVSDILNRLVAYLPNVFAAVLIVIVAAAVARAVKDILEATLAGLGYGRFLATVVSAFTVAVGIFAALNELNIAPAIVNGLFYAMLAIIAGSAIVAIGGGGIGPMRGQWEKALGRLEREAPQIRSRVQTLSRSAAEAAPTQAAPTATVPQNQRTLSE